MASVPVELLRELEIEGYTAVMRAIYAGSYDWEKEEILTKLRGILNIDNNQHADVLATVKEEMQALRSGGKLPNKQVPLAARVGSSTYPVPGGGLRKQPSAAARAMGGGASTPRAAGGLGSASAKARGGKGRGADPYGYVGRRVWRYWASENPPWVEGYVHEYDPDLGTHSILYDANQPGRETVEDSYSFANASPADFVLGDFVDVKTMHGSRRVAERPQEVVIPNPALGGALNTPSSGTDGGLAGANKKRRSQPAVQVPNTAPFDVTWLQTRLQMAGEEELQSMHVVLERREAEILAELTRLEGVAISEEDQLARAELEAQFTDLCERESKLMAELASLVAAEE